MSIPVHIVCLDAPSPPDYGGAIDMFYKIKALRKTGHKIILHYYSYNPARSTQELEGDCMAIYAYQRKNFFQSLPLTRPFIIQSRINHALIQRLNADRHPVLLEGLHCAGLIPFLHHPERIVLRMHNEEASYYHHLAQTETSFLKKTYFTQESRLLHRYQQTMDKHTKLACLSETDKAVFENSYQFFNTHFTPCFIPWQKVDSLEGKSDYCLYHGNLSVPENEQAACWLIDQVFSQTKLPLVVAGKGISDKLFQRAKKNSNISLVNNPSITEINNLVRDAQINVLPSLNRTGVKLKLLNALLNGRHCITNNAGVRGSRITGGVVVQDAAEGWKEAVQALIHQPFTPTDKKERAQILALYNNTENAHRLSELWSHCQ